MSADPPLGVVTQDDAALYDRQIRLWGFDAQSRLQQAQVLLIGLTGTMTEIAKNLVLAGVGGVSLLSASSDSSLLQPRHLAAQFLVSQDYVGKPREVAALARLHDLNPRVKISVLTGHVFDGRDIIGMTLHSLSLSLSLSTHFCFCFFVCFYFEALMSGFRIICVSNVGAFSRDQLETLDSTCRQNRVPFILADTAGLTGFSFFDADSHSYGAQSAEHPSLAQVLALADWSAEAYRRASQLFFMLSTLLQTALPLSPALLTSEKLGHLLSAKVALCSSRGRPTAFPDARYQEFLKTFGREFSPVCSIVGGFVGQEIISLITAKEEPLPNFFLYDGNTGEGSSLTFPLTQR
ncbi:MAG: ThiF family adenylyltransferase [archaeon]|nr:ThiF family adenylyltransferase [archaeon]